MNPFIAFLILVPLLVSILFTIITALILIEDGPGWGIISALVILIAISGSLILLLKRTSRSPLLEFPGSDQVDVAIRRKLTTFFLVVIYGTLIFMAFFLVNIESVRNWLGVICTILGLLMCYSGIYQLRLIHIPEPNQSTESITKQIKMLEMFLSSRTITRNGLLASLILTGFLGVILYRRLEAVRYFSLLDLIGILFLTASLWLWFTLYGISRRRKLEVLKAHLEQGTVKSSAS